MFFATVCVATTSEEPPQSHLLIGCRLDGCGCTVLTCVVRRLSPVCICILATVVRVLLHSAPIGCPFQMWVPQEGANTLELRAPLLGEPAVGWGRDVFPPFKCISLLTIRVSGALLHATGGGHDRIISPTSAWVQKENSMAWILALTCTLVSPESARSLCSAELWCATDMLQDWATAEEVGEEPVVRTECDDHDRTG